MQGGPYQVGFIIKLQAEMTGGEQGKGTQYSRKLQAE